MTNQINLKIIIHIQAHGKYYFKPIKIDLFLKFWFFIQFGIQEMPSHP